jgi:hypothetical protein
MIVARVLKPGSKRATARALDPETAETSLGQVLDLGPLDEDELYGALDWLVRRQDRVERRLAKRTLNNGALVLYDLTSSWLEGRVRPIFPRRDRRGRAHVFVCMLAFYVEWHMRQALAPMLFDDHDRRSAKSSPVAKARRTADGLAVHGFRTVLGDLATLTLNTVATKGDTPVTFTAYATPTALQKKAFELLATKHAPSRVLAVNAQTPRRIFTKNNGLRAPSPGTSD